MSHELNRYFIELQPDDLPQASTSTTPRQRENEVRRERAVRFLEKIGVWLRQNELSNKVSALAVTALGQVQITCEADIINQIRDEDDLNIASIRPGAMFVDAMHRWNDLSSVALAKAEASGS